MAERELAGGGANPLVEQVLGFLNFSSGTSDPQFLANVNALFGQIALETTGKIQRPVWKRLGQRLRESLEALTQVSPTFRDAEQAASVLALVFESTLPAYRQFHADSLFHHTDET